MAGIISEKQLRSSFPARRSVALGPGWLLALLIFAHLGVNGFAQALVNFNNNVLSPVPLVYFGDPNAGGTAVLGTNFLAQLYYGKDFDDLRPVAKTPAKFRASAGAGTWAGGMRTLDGVDCGETVTLQVRIWDGGQFPTWEDDRRPKF